MYNFEGINPTIVLSVRPLQILREIVLSNLWLILSFCFLLIALDNFTEIALISKVLPFLVLVIKSRDPTSSLTLIDVLVIYSIAITDSYSKL